MPKKMGNSRRGPDDLDRARESTGMDEDEERFASPDGPVLGEGENVGPWSEQEPEEEDELSAGSSRRDEGDEADDGGGYQADSGNGPSESERPTGGRSRSGSDSKSRPKR
jgi:hypothetical protein